MIDLRSDTVTHPTRAMREAMASAEVGDDVYGGDPTVQRLEEVAAERLGKQAALFVPSGTMANQIAVKVWTRPGQQVLADAGSHLVLYEMASTALISGVALGIIPGETGWFRAQDVEARLAEPQTYGSTSIGLVEVENTHNRAGGTLFPQQELAAIGRVCRQHGLPVHMDGARIFNASVASGRPAAELAAEADSVMFCLSKGLACPVGSMLCGPRDFIDEARRIRQVLGGGMRQSGVIAAAGLVALESMVSRLAEDHRRAKELARGLAGCPGVRVDLDRVTTNIVYFELERDSAPELQTKLEKVGVLSFAVAPRTVRMVTHYQVSDEDVAGAVEAVESYLADLSST